jgi:hypothetical protein
MPQKNPSLAWSLSKVASTLARRALKLKSKEQKSPSLTSNRQAPPLRNRLLEAKAPAVAGAVAVGGDAEVADASKPSPRHLPRPP